MEGWEKKEAYDAALAAGRTALDQEDYNEAERQAGRALELIPRDEAAKQLFSQAQRVKLQKEAVAIEKRPTAVTMAQLAGNSGCNSGDKAGRSERDSEFEEADREEQEKKEQAERERVEKEKLQKDEERRQAGPPEANQGMYSLDGKGGGGVGSGRWTILWVEGLGIIEGQTTGAEVQGGDGGGTEGVRPKGLRYSDRPSRNGAGDQGWGLEGDETEERCASAQSGDYGAGAKVQEAMEAGQKAYDLKDYDTAIAQAETALAIRAGDLKAARTQERCASAKSGGCGSGSGYNVAMEAGRKAYDLKDYDTAIAQAEAALAIKAGDLKAATKLRAMRKRANAERRIGSGGTTWQWRQDRRHTT